MSVLTRYAWLPTVPDDEFDDLRAVDAACEDPISVLSQALDDEHWRRRSVAVHAWPETVLGTGPSVPLGGSRVYFYCAQARGFEDPDHRPRRVLSEDLHGGGRKVMIECSCGARAVDHRMRVVDPGDSARSWVKEMRDGVIYFLLCPDTPTANHPDHFLLVQIDEGVESRMSCGCGRGFRHDKCSGNVLYRARVLPAF